MKALSISQKQKEKLLEICESLFQEYYFRISNNFIQGISYELSGFLNMDNFDCGYDDESSPEEQMDTSTCNIEVNIHWFEFCITKLYNEFKRRSINIDLYFFTLTEEHCQWPKEYNHPIDYLYFKFKKNSL